METAKLNGVDPHTWLAATIACIPAYKITRVNDLLPWNCRSHRTLTCWRDERYVSQQLACSCDRQRIILEENEITRGLPGKYVDSFEYPDGRLEFHWKGVSRPYSVFDKDQRVTHSAITENKHLSAVLEHIKAEQDKAPPKKRRAGEQRSRYKPNGRRNDGRNSLADRKRIADCKASQGCDI
ncbi:transposase domain-containing protein [Fluviibacterium sp. DFM31]|uniref:Transposase domain-containing protein n=1 Tax=Meridianimarinicoccus marinus TaxID=3231483 RepID=A0ABV3L7J9_9RHOB